MDEDEALGRKRLIEQPVLDSFGVAELHEYIAALQGEIARAEAMIARKTGHRGVAEALFGKK